MGWVSEEGEREGEREGEGREREREREGGRYGRRVKEKECVWSMTSGTIYQFKVLLNKAIQADHTVLLWTTLTRLVSNFNSHPPG